MSESQPLLAAPKPPPDFNIPESNSTVDVRVIDTNTLLFIDPKLFLHPQIAGYNGSHAPIYCFLISHGNRHIIFDLGVRKDWKNYAPRIVSLIKATTTVSPGEHDIASMLDNSNENDTGIRSKDIEAIIWSHNHFDHIGDPSTFPPTTDLIVGPSVTAASWPGWPRNPDAGVLDSDITGGRVVHEINFDKKLKFGRFDAFDFFGDGSFYLLDGPGHAVGHLCAVARTTANPSSFVFMGADACHHPGALRPTEYLPLPISLPIPSPLSSYPTSTCIGTCPGSLFQNLTINQSASSPFFTVAQGPLFPDHEAAMTTVQKIQELDALDNVFVLIAHDLSLRDRIPLFPERINGWEEMDLRGRTRWVFCGEFTCDDAV
ncbi:hypothetical protein TCE0_041f14119 [Talaromyces pinophilus]|uniref:Metallo-beta-lactamase domain-containing protein n=1 Tax=Talaromyces pinophilus TaxID=128442 RepID=A0A6V8HNH4_TALPI|nr:hypothetical protein TCE0_041f14119 [Talaromyces pinophilus]